MYRADIRNYENDCLPLQQTSRRHGVSPCKQGRQDRPAVKASAAGMPHHERMCGGDAAPPTE